MARYKGIPKKNITTTISIVDDEYTKQHRLTITNLLASAIAIHRNAHEQGVKGDYFKYLKNKVEQLNSKYSQAMQFIHLKGLHDEFEKQEVENEAADILS